MSGLICVICVGLVLSAYLFSLTFNISMLKSPKK